MRHLRITFGLAIAAGVFAVSGTPALAHEFEAYKELGKTIPPQAKALGVGILKAEPTKFEFEKAQELKFGPFRIFCTKAKTRGLVNEEKSTTFTTTIKFQSCGYYFKTASLYHVGAKFSPEGLKMVYHANKFVEAEGNPELEEFEHEKMNGEIEVFETAIELKISAAKMCKIQIPAQTIPVNAKGQPVEETNAVNFENVERTPAAKEASKFPSGKQKKLVIGNELKGIKFFYAGGGGEQQCEEESGEEHFGLNGLYKGLLEEEVVGGNLLWK